MKKVVAFGDPFDGITLVGPFDSSDEAIAYAEAKSADYEDWDVVDLEVPDDGLDNNMYKETE